MTDRLHDVGLQGSVVHLEPMTLAHLDALAEVGLDPELWRLTVSRVRDRNELAAWMRHALAARDAGTALPFVIRHVASGRLVGAIRSSADEAAALGEEISAATEQMTSSTQEVAATTQELTDRATRQATTVRSVAEEAGRILAISQELATSSLQAADRNAALVRLAEKHRSGLRTSTAELGRLADEVEQGTQEAEALARATEEIEENYRKLSLAEAEVRAERDRLDLIINAVADPVLVTDESGSIVLMNPPAEHLFTANQKDRAGSSGQLIFVFQITP